MQAVLKKSDGCSCLRYAMAMVGAMLGTAVMAQPVSTKPTAPSAAHARSDMRKAPGRHLSYPPGKPFHLDQVGDIAINRVNHTGYAIPAEQCIGNEVATFDTRTKTAGPSINDPVLVDVCSQATDNTDKTRGVVWWALKVVL